MTGEWSSALAGNRPAAPGKSWLGDECRLRGSDRHRLALRFREPSSCHLGGMLMSTHRRALVLAALAAPFLLVGVQPCAPTHAQGVASPSEGPADETLEATVTRVIGESYRESPDGTFQQVQDLELLVTRGSLSGETIRIDTGAVTLANLPRYEVGDKLQVTRSSSPEGGEYFLITDYVRRDALVKLFLIFVVVAVLVGRQWGLASIIGMAFSFLVIFAFILPRILAGGNPVLVTVAGSLAIVPVTFYLSHGLNRKTTTAIVGTAIALGITGLLAVYFAEAAKLSGYASEEAAYLREAAGQVGVDVKGLLLSGIIIGTLGVLDDVTVSQAAVVRQLRRTKPDLSRVELYRRAMSVGQDHISSMVNTLVLVYTGAALPLLLLFLDARLTFWEVLNYEFIADEIVRTLVGSIGLILAVPCTTVLSSYVGERANSEVDG